MTRTMQVLWTGADGSNWDLTGLDSTVQLVSLEGLGMPGFSQQFTNSAARDGRRYEGTSYNQAALTLTVSVGDLEPVAGTRRKRTGDAWRALDRAWRHAVDPEVPGTLRIVTGTTDRSLGLRLDQPFGVPAAVDPALIGEATYALSMTADDRPWWIGAEVPAEFTISTGARPFFSGGSGNRLYISETDRLGSAKITNPGDRPAYPKWWARGPFSSITVGVGDEVVKIPFPRAAGQMVYVDSENETIVDENGTSLWDLMGFIDPTFAPIPSGENVDLVTIISDGDNSDGGSAIGVSLVPNFKGPW